MRARLREWSWIGIAIAGSALAAWRIHDFGLLGLDTLPSIETSRIESWSDVLGAFGQRLMTTHNYYRPLLSVSIGLDHALHGLESTGYQLTSAACFALCALALGLLLRRLLGGEARIGPALGVTALVLFPLHLEVLPVVPRRGELMAGGFLLMALATQLSPAALALRRPPLAPALWMLLGLASKDTVLALWPLCPLVVLLYSDEPTRRARFRHAARSALPHAAVLAGFLALRTIVLGGLGGNPRQDGLANLGTFPELLWTSALRILRPELGEPSAAGTALAVGVALASLALPAFGTSRADDRGDRGGERARRACLRGLTLGLAWLLLLVLVYSLRGVWQRWYVFLLALAWSVALGSLGELARLLRRRSNDRVPRVAGTCALLVICASLAHQATRSPLLRGAPDWLRETAAVEGFYAELARRVDATAPGSSVQVPELEDTREPGFASGVTDVSPSSIRSWMRLSRPDVSFRLVLGRKRPKVRPHEIVLLYGA